MKTTLTVLIATLCLLTTPLLAAAHDDSPRKQSSERYSKSRDHDRHEQRHDYRDHRANYRFDRRMEKPYRNYSPQRYAHSRRELRHQRPVYVSAPAVIFGVPQIVFRLDW